MSLEAIKRRMRRRALELGALAFGVSEAVPVADHRRYQAWIRRGWQGDMGYLARNEALRADPRQVLPGARSVICVALPHGPPLPEHGMRGGAGLSHPEGPSAPLADGAEGTGLAAEESLKPRNASPHLAALFAGEDYHRVTRRLLDALVADAQGLLPTPARWLPAVDTAPLLERSLAVSAGLGTIGRHTQLILPDHGSLVCLGLLLTDLPLPPDAPMAFDPCRGCDACLEACPTGALHRDLGLEAPRCLSYHTTASHGPIPEPLRPLVGLRLYGCDTCQDACPWNHPTRRKAPDPGHPDLRGDPCIRRETLEGWLALSGRRLKATVSGTAMDHLPAPALRRNICVVLGNLGDPRSRPALEGVAANAAHPMVADHAAWALGRLRSS